MKESKKRKLLQRKPHTRDTDNKAYNVMMSRKHERVGNNTRSNVKK